MKKYSFIYSFIHLLFVSPSEWASIPLYIATDKLELRPSLSMLSVPGHNGRPTHPKEGGGVEVVRSKQKPIKQSNL